MVKAMTMDGQLVEEVHLFNSDWKYITVYRTNGAAPGGNYQTQAIYFDSDMYYHNTDADYLVMSWKSYFKVEDQVTEHQYYGSSGSGMYTWTNYDTKVIQVIPRVQLIAQTGSWSTCELQNNLIVCPIFKNQTYTGLQFEAFMPQDDGVLDVNWYIGLNPWANTYRTNTNSLIQSQENSTNSIINNQNQQHNETMNYFNDSNVTEADSQASNFFSNFTSQDNGGISSIITAPLSAISGLVSATCQQIVLPLPYLDNKQLVLPCMSAIYTEHFGAFFSIYQTIIFGAIAYRMLVSIFMMIQGFKNPPPQFYHRLDS